VLRVPLQPDVFTIEPQMHYSLKKTLANMVDKTGPRINGWIDRNTAL